MWNNGESDRMHVEGWPVFWNWSGSCRAACGGPGVESDHTGQGVRKHSAGGSTDVRSILASCLGCRSPGGEGRAGRGLDKGEVVAGERGRSWGGLAPWPPPVTGCQLDPLEHGVIEANQGHKSAARWVWQVCFEKACTQHSTLRVGNFKLTALTAGKSQVRLALCPFLLFESRWGHSRRVRCVCGQCSLSFQREGREENLKPRGALLVGVRGRLFM